MKATKHGDLKKKSQSSIPIKVKHWTLGLKESMKDPDNIVKETKNVIVIKDKYPKAKIHYLILPKAININSIFELEGSHIELLEEFDKMYEDLKSEHENLNLISGFHAIPTMQLLHMHVISTDFISPCLKTKIHWNSFNTNILIPYAGLLAMLKENGSIKRMSAEEHKSLRATPLKCNQCSFQPKTIPQLKMHLLSHEI